ncbi:unnamed protein product, partial [Timema podura]|nr:unnamed protein product [Timema podura]
MSCLEFPKIREPEVIVITLGAIDSQFDTGPQELRNHVGSCGFEPIYCENKCGMKVQRRHLSQHKAAECSKRLVPCRYCAKEFVADTLQAHHSKCGRFPVACPNRCESAILAREDLDAHLKDQCSTLGICCAFKEAGCRFK